MKTNWPDDRIMRELAARDPGDERSLAGSAGTPEARAALDWLLAVEVEATPVSGAGHRRRWPRARSLEPAAASAPTRPRSRRLPVLSLGVGGVGVLVVVLVTTVLAGSGPAQPAAAAVLAQFATTASQEPSMLGPGQYDYLETESSTGMGSMMLANGQRVYYDRLVTMQDWVAADGSGEEVRTQDLTPQFFTPSQRAEWEAEGSPPLPVTGPTRQTTWPVSATDAPLNPSMVHPPDPLYDVSGLPTDEADLAEVLATGQGLPSSLQDVRCGNVYTATAACYTFWRAATILQGPDTGSSPALRSALFAVLADVSGVRNLGTVTSRAGEQGTGLSFTVRHPDEPTVVNCQVPSVLGPETATYTIGAYTLTFEIVVDPQTTAVISVSQSASKRPPPEILSCTPVGGPSSGTVSGTRTLAKLTPGWVTPGANTPTLKGRAAPTWTTVLGSGVVGSDTALPAGTTPASGPTSSSTTT
jgi:hypothetical protein